MADAAEEKEGIDIKRHGKNRRLGDEIAGSVESQQISTSYQSLGAVSDAPSGAGSTSTSSGNSSNEMTMFHVVFVMNPPPLEYQARVADMYDNVTKKFAKALKYEQASTGYVWRESKKILELKAAGKQNGMSLC